MIKSTPFILVALTVNLFFGAMACKEEQDGRAPGPPSSKAIGDDKPAGLKVSERPQLPNVSAFDLDKSDFNMENVITGRQTFMNSETVVLSFIKPKLADYVEIMRCKASAKLASNSGGISLADIKLTGLTEADLSRFYLENDVFGLATTQKITDCHLISDGFADDNKFEDTYAPSGSFRYFVRSCVHPRRLNDREHLSNRNCSRRYGVSEVVLDYVNKRAEKEIKHRAKAQEYMSKIDTEANGLSYLAHAGSQALDRCAVAEQNRAIYQKVRSAWMTIASAVVDVAIEFHTADLSEEAKLKPNAGRSELLFDHYANPSENYLDKVQLLNSIQGSLFAGPVNLVMSSAHDMPRSCTEYLQIVSLFELAQSRLTLYAYRIAYHNYMIDLVLGHERAVDGLDPGLDPPTGGL